MVSACPILVTAFRMSCREDRNNVSRSPAGLVNRPRLLLLDEPLGALDAKLREEMQIELINLQKEVGITFVFVTHAQNEALALSHRIAVMNRGNVEQIDEPSKIYGFPRKPVCCGFYRQDQHDERARAGSCALPFET